MKVDLTIDELAAIYALEEVSGIGPLRMKALITRYISAEKILQMDWSTLVRVENMSEDSAKQVAESVITEDHYTKARRIREKSVKILHFLNSNYPYRLRQIPNVPTLLYTIGTIKQADDRALAIVGTRSSTKYGHDVTKLLVAQLVDQGFTIVSGLARGIDTQAHYTALQTGGRTLAILGSGPDRIYPAENTDLAREIARQGAVCTEYYLGTQPDAGNFPDRNRIISGLTLGTIVVEAGNKSGAILTALLALEQNREVFAVPGRISDKQSIGTNRLIKHGAKLVQSVDDILEELTGQLTFEGAGAPEPLPEPPPDLDENEQEIYELLQTEPVHIDKIAVHLGDNPSVVLGTLLDMELRGVVEQLPGKVFTRKQR